MKNQSDPLQTHLNRFREFIAEKNLDKDLSNQDFHDICQQYVEIVMHNAG